MAGKFVVDRQGRTFRLIAHLDTTKTIPDPADSSRQVPDPEWTFEQQWTADPGPAGETAAQRQARLDAYLAAIKVDFRRNAADALARKQPQASAAALLAGTGEAL